MSNQLYTAQLIVNPDMLHSSLRVHPARRSSFCVLRSSFCVQLPARSQPAEPADSLHGKLKLEWRDASQ
jgi:hypothetical protein